MSDTTGAVTTAHSPRGRGGSVLVALCRLPAVAGSVGLLLVLLTPLGRWEPVAMLTWLGAGFALCFNGVERRALRWFGRARPCLPGEREILDGPWQAACAAAGIPQTDATLYVCASSEVNAFAVGRRTICVTSKALSEMVARRITDDQVTALLLHEIGHLRHGDTRLGMQLSWLSAPWRVASRITLSVCAKIAGPQPLTLLGAVALTAGGVAITRAVQTDDRATATVLATLVVCAVVVPVLDAHLARRGEYAADRFVAACRYGAEMIRLLTEIDSTPERPSRHAITQRHPTLARRCGRIMGRAAVK